MTVNLFSENPNQLNDFLSRFYNTDFGLEKKKRWEKKYANPVEIADIIGIYIDNIDLYNLNMWISLDKDVYIHVTNENGNEIIKYLFERFPY